MHTVVRITSIGEDEQVNDPDRYWHLMAQSCGDRTTLCQGLMIDGADIVFVSRKVERGCITCDDCIKIIKLFQYIKL